MTESEAKGFVQGKLDCMEKCDVFNREDKHRNNDCDNCEYCYSQGTFGEQKEAFRMAINALEKQIPEKPYCVEDKMWCYPVCYNNLLKIKEDYSKGMQTSCAKFMYNKALDDFVKEICKMIIQSEKNGNYRFYAVEIKQAIVDLAEQLKAGAED